MKLFLSFLLISSNLFATAFEEIDIHGDTNYIKSSSQSLITSLTTEYKIKLHEPYHKRYMIYLGGTITSDYDHFGKTVRVNSFTNLGIEF